MDSFGFKIIDRYEPIVADIIEEAAGQYVPLEVGFYKGEASVRDLVRRQIEPEKLNVHFNHKQYAIVNIDRDRERFATDMQAAKALGATYGIQHISSTPMTKQEGYAARMFGTLMSLIEETEILCEENGFDIYLENTYEPLGFYEKLYSAIRERGFSHIHFCFDIGHAKVWSGRTFDDWMHFLSSLQSEEFSIHFHLHANRGLGDEHLSFVEMTQMNFDGDDGVFSEMTYAKMLQTIAERFPVSRKVFEVKPEFAFENMAWVRDTLNH